VRTKEELLKVQKQVFGKMEWFVWPCLIVNVYSVLQDDPASFRAIIDTQSRAMVIGIPMFNYDSAPLRCEIRPRGDGVWQLSSMFVEWELVKK